MTWSPSTDRHAHGKLRCISLILVRNDKEEFCLGCIGTEECCFCRRSLCNIMSHHKRWYKLEFQEGYYIPTVGHKFPRKPSAFKTPFVDALRMTPEGRAVVTDMGENGMKTTSKWEEFIMQAKVAWHVSQVAAQRGQGAGILEGSNKDDASSKSTISLPNKPGFFTFKDAPTFRNLEFGTDGEGVPEGKSTDPTLLEIGSAIEELDQKMQAAMGTIREDQLGIMDHLWTSILRLGSAAHLVKARMQGIEDVAGNAEAVLDKHTLGDLSKGFLMALEQLDATATPDIQDLKDKVGGLTDLIKAVDEDHKRVACFLLGKVNRLGPPQIQGSRTEAVGASLPLTMEIVDDMGEEIGTFKQLLRGMKDLLEDNTCLHKQVESLLADIMSQGGGDSGWPQLHI
jgi:hypothetical protein